MNLKLKRTIIAVPVASLFLISGCAHLDPNEPIKKFHEASVVVINNARTEYQTANKIARDAEIDRLANKGEQIDPKILDDPKLIVVSKNAMDFRMAAFDALTEHGKLLAQLASSNAQNESKDAVKSLNDAVMKLSGSLGGAPSEALRSSAGAFATIAGEVSKLVMEHKIEEALRKAIIASDKDVTDLMTLLEEDINGMLYENKRSNLALARRTATDVYNKVRTDAPSDLERRWKASKEIKKAADAWAAPPPDIGLGKMRKAHKDLVKYAKHPKTPQSFAELVKAMNEFADEAKVIADAIRIIR
jgi:hypothetical protein